MLAELVPEYLDLATNGTAGRSEQDSIYRAITEGRDTGKAYSSCGDLCHWLLFRLGVRSAYVNRAEHRGWKSGVNIGRLVFNCPEARPPTERDTYQAGDILAIWNDPNGTDGHVLVVREHVGIHLHSADYGQPGGARRTRLLQRGALDGRKLQRVLPLAAVLQGAAKRGELVETETARAWLARVSTRNIWPTLRLGSQGPDVVYLQERLNAKGADLDTDGDFGPVTRETVRAYQRAHKLRDDGVVGEATWAVLERAP